MIPAASHRRPIRRVRTCRGGDTELLFPSNQLIVYASREESFGKARGIDGSDAFFTLSDVLTPISERDVRPDRSGSSDHLERWIGRKSAAFEINMLLSTDANLLFDNVFGQPSGNGADVDYMLSTGHTESLTIRRAIRGDNGAAYQDHVRGAIVTEAEVAWGNYGHRGLAAVTFRGSAKDWGWTGNTSIASGYLNISSVASTFRVASSRQLSIGSLFKVGTSTGGGSGILVDSVNHTNGVVSFSQSLGTTLSSGYAVSPYNPTAITAGSPLHIRQGAFLLDDSSMDHLGGVIDLVGGRSLVNEEVGQESPNTIVSMSRRNVVFGVDFMAKKDEVGDLLGDMERNTAHDISIEIGNVRISMRKIEWNMKPVHVPENESAKLRMVGQALGTNDNDSLQMSGFTLSNVGHWGSDSSPGWASATTAEKAATGFWGNSFGYALTLDAASRNVSRWGY